ncbi:MAG: DUF2959 family protein [Verrucomicrobiales bacterium]
MMTKTLPAIFFLPVLFLSSCSTAYYGAMEKLGYEKRDILVSRVKKAKKSQIEAKEEFKTALDAFLDTTKVKGSALEKKYRQLDGAYEDAKARADEVRERNDEVEKVGKALFKEWDREIKSFENPEFKAQSASHRRASLARFNSLTSAARRAEKSLDPVLSEFRDHVLFLKHNLNAQAVNSLAGEVRKTEINVSRLIADMERAIAKADAFLQQLN